MSSKEISYFIARSRETGNLWELCSVVALYPLYVREPLGVIILEGCTVELAEEETDVFAFKVRLGANYVGDH